MATAPKTDMKATSFKVFIDTNGIETMAAQIQIQALASIASLWTRLFISVPAKIRYMTGVATDLLIGREAVLAVVVEAFHEQDGGVDAHEKREQQNANTDPTTHLEGVGEAKRASAYT